LNAPTIAVPSNSNPPLDVAHRLIILLKILHYKRFQNR